ncbi:cupin domain-containing protein [Patescibacteria group bacterium]
MDIKIVTRKLKRHYPGCEIIITDPENPTEIICEIQPTVEHPKWSGIIAVIDRTRLHYHKMLTETYHVLDGKLSIYLNGKKQVLKKGDLVKIPPKTIHWSQGDETWVYVYSTPGWIGDDHVLVESL